MKDANTGNRCLTRILLSDGRHMMASVNRLVTTTPASTFSLISGHGSTIQNFLWMTGDPGCGKSAITASLVCYWKGGGTLWAIDRNIEATANPRVYFPSISQQMASCDKVVEKATFDILKAKPSLLDSMTLGQARILLSRWYKLRIRESP